MKLLEEFKESFAEGKLGKTSSVKHSTKTHGPPIRQPIRRLPVTLKSTVQKEVQKMHSVQSMSTIYFTSCASHTNKPYNRCITCT